VCQKLEYEEAILVTQGLSEDGGKLRPADWIERISSTLASFGCDHPVHSLVLCKVKSAW
jgi:hypothetical protein